MDAIVRKAEEVYELGMEQLRYGKPRSALLLFQRAITISDETTASPKRQARYLSYSGICIFRTGGPLQEAYRLCNRAVRIDSESPALWRNLARVATAAGHQGQAHHALNHALGMNPGHTGILRDLRKLGTRRTPVLPFLARANPLNVTLGKLRAWMHTAEESGVATPR